MLEQRQILSILICDIEIEWISIRKWNSFSIRNEFLICKSKSEDVFVYWDQNFKLKEKWSFNTEALGATHKSLQISLVNNSFLEVCHTETRGEHWKQPRYMGSNLESLSASSITKEDLPHKWHHCHRNMKKFPVEHFLDMLDIKYQVNIKTPRRSLKNK